MKLQKNKLYAQIALVLHDPGNLRWTAGEIDAWIGNAQAEIAAVQPDAAAKRSFVTLPAGVSQRIPDEAMQLLDIAENETGEPVQIVSRELMDTQNPDWRKSRPAKIIRHAMTDPLSPRDFLVWPPSDGTARIALVCATLPENGDIVLDAVWMPAVLNYVLFRALAKDAEFAGNANTAAAYYQAFLSQMSGRGQAEAGTNPNLANEPRNPGVPLTLSR
jgi:hypothetical protein